MMKKLVLLSLVCFVFCSCKNKYEQALSDQVQNLGETKMDLNFKLIKVEELQNILAKDSLDYWIENRSERLKNAINSAKDQMDFYKSYCDKGWDSFLDSYEKYKKEYERLINGTPEDLYPVYDEILSRYSSLAEGSIIAIKIKATYSIKNPFLNGTKQEITDTFIVSPDGKTCYEKIKEK